MEADAMSVLKKPVEVVAANDHQAWFDTAEAAQYIRVSKEAMRKLVQRGTIRPDAPAGANGLRGHRFSRRTLDRHLGGG
jgi:excisionase family DNA binding protein